MTDTSGYPVANAPSTAAYPAVPGSGRQAPPYVDALHSDAEAEMLEKLYAELKPMAVDNYINYFLARTPAHLQGDMLDILKTDLASAPVAPPPEGETGMNRLPSDPPTENSIGQYAAMRAAAAAADTKKDEIRREFAEQAGASDQPARGRPTQLPADPPPGRTAEPPSPIMPR